MSIEVINYKPFEKGSLVAFVDLYVPKMGLEIYGCSIHRKDDGRWLNLPSKEYQDKETGETKWSSVIRFRDKDHFAKFCKAALHVVDEHVRQNQAPAPTQPMSNFVDEGMPF